MPIKPTCKKGLGQGICVQQMLLCIIVTQIVTLFR
uniref:Uncharacterized protein n=1 Tax=Rhizophora mucronata TaxID=61149 RepID=A0A2P2NUX3_RHIMU